jgi:hypothetical protein
MHDAGFQGSRFERLGLRAWTSDGKEGSGFRFSVYDLRFG